jgi:hypothetical protein
MSKAPDLGSCRNARVFTRSAQVLQIACILHDGPGRLACISAADNHARQALARATW